MKIYRKIYKIIDKEYKGISRRINIEKIKYLDKDLLKLYHL